MSILPFLFPLFTPVSAFLSPQSCNVYSFIPKFFLFSPSLSPHPTPNSLRVFLSSRPPFLPILTPSPPASIHALPFSPAPSRSPRGKALHEVRHTGCRGLGLRSLLNTILVGRAPSHFQAHTGTRAHTHISSPSLILSVSSQCLSPSVRHHLILANH